MTKEMNLFNSEGSDGDVAEFDNFFRKVQEFNREHAVITGNIYEGSREHTGIIVHYPAGGVIDTDILFTCDIKKLKESFDPENKELRTFVPSDFSTLVTSLNIFCKGKIKHEDGRVVRVDAGFSNITGKPIYSQYLSIAAD